MAGEDSMDFRTVGVGVQAQPGPYTQYLKADSLIGKRFGVPAFILRNAAGGTSTAANNHSGQNLRPETRAMFMSAIEALRRAGAFVVIDESILPDSFAELVRKINTRPYRLEGTQNFLRTFGPPQYHSAEEYEMAVGSPLPPVVTGLEPPTSRPGTTGERGPQEQTPTMQTVLETDPQVDINFFSPQRKALAAYLEPFDAIPGGVLDVLRCYVYRRPSRRSV
jgi:hypothetical protein